MNLIRQQKTKTKKFRHHMDKMNSCTPETSELQQKLQSKNEALRILREELEVFRTERDQFKLMAETLQLRYSAIRRNTDYTESGFKGNSGVVNLLNEQREKNIKLTTEVEALKQKLHELQGDMKILREKCIEKNQSNNVNRNSSKGEIDWRNEKADFISHLENLKKLNVQMTFDLKATLDEKEEIVMERDAFKCKAHRLNHELNIALKASESNPRILDIDGLILENKHLQDKLKNCESELEYQQQTVVKYKNMLETKRKKGIIKLGTSSFDNLKSNKQVKKLLDNDSELPTKAETISELKSLCLVLLDNLNDKNLALSHQKKTNKILADKITELELILANSNCPTSFSPSEILLSNYNPTAYNDEEEAEESTTKSSKIIENLTEDSGTMSSEDTNSSDSNRSIISSEYDNAYALNILNSTSVHTNKPLIPTSMEQERLDDLKDMPPELAEIVQKNLHDLDLKEQQET